MTFIYDENVEQAIRERLHEHEAAKQAAERKFMAIRNTIGEEESAIAHLQFVLDDYRKAHGLPSQPDKPSPVLEAEYSHLGPTALVEYWAHNHGGEVIVKDLAKVAINAGMFAQYRHAASSIYAVLKRKPFKKIRPGYFKRVESTPSENGQNIAIHLPATISFEDAEDCHSEGESSYDNPRLQ